jgi:hypothetical protein
LEGHNFPNARRARLSPEPERQINSASELQCLAGVAKTVDIKRAGASFGQLDELAKPHPQARSQFIGNLDSHANLPKLNGADIGPVDLGLLGKFLLGKTLFLSLLSNGAAKGSCENLVALSTAYF